MAHSAIYSVKKNMRHPIHIRFSGMESSIALTTTAEAYAYGLAWVESEIIACWVGICLTPEQALPGGPFSVRLDVKIPGHELAVQRVQHEDIYLAMGYAFHDMERQLKCIDPWVHHAEYATTVNGQLVTLEEAFDAESNDARKVRFWKH